jgi:hypothetical protein
MANKGECFLIERDSVKERATACFRSDRHAINRHTFYMYTFIVSFSPTCCIRAIDARLA